MSTVSRQPETRIIVRNVSWAAYEAILADGDRIVPRFVYDRGTLEIMLPSAQHEWYHRLIGQLIEAYTLEQGIPRRSGGSTTLKAQLEQRGLEPDECYYISREPLVRGRDEIDLANDPPPDIAIEVEISNSSIDKLAIYADLGIKEVWFYDGDVLSICVLQEDGKYAKRPRSAELPQLSKKVLERFLARRYETDETSWIRAFHKWARKKRKQ